MPARRSLLALLAALAAGLVACGDARPLQTTAGGGSACAFCHGTSGRVGNLPGTDPNLAAAPPIAPPGEPSQVVGAHQAHLNPPATGSLRGPIACNECHVVPTDTAHASSPPAQVVQFGTLARTGGAAPTWNSPDKVTNTTCSNVYCHGNFNFGGVTGNAANAPDWTGTGQAACGSCHGLPPAGHIALPGTPTAATCNGCHPGTVDASGRIIVNAATEASLHVNGRSDGAGGHPDPDWYVDPAANPGFSPRGGNHTVAALDFTSPSTGLAGCLQCHANYGSANGDPASSCNACHAAALTGAATTNWQQNCVFCHGDSSKRLTYAVADQTSDPWIIAPPVGSQGETLTTQVAVGAHQKHVNPGAGLNVLSNAIACTECHPSPLPADVAHVNGVVALPLAGPLARTSTGTFTPSPSWNAGTNGCAATYCHGSYPQGGNNATPVWTTVNGSFAACTSCHGAPPTTGEHSFHVSSKGRNCSDCHNGIATGLGSSLPITNGVIVGKSLHVNGVRNVVFSSAAGGTAAWNPAPTAQNAAAGTCNNVLCHGSGTNSKSW